MIFLKLNNLFFHMKSVKYRITQIMRTLIKFGISQYFVHILQHFFKTFHKIKITILFTFDSILASKSHTILIGHQLPTNVALLFMKKKHKNSTQIFQKRKYQNELRLFGSNFVLM